MQPRTVYLKSYDFYNEILEYRLPEGKFAILPRDQFITLGIAPAFGAFSREGEQVAGVFASPEGPVFFLDAQHVVGSFGRTSAIVSPVLSRSKLYFAFAHRETSGERIEFGLLYQKRLGIGANPYDNEEEDIDLFAMIAAGVRCEPFFRQYTREWVGKPL